MMKVDAGLQHVYLITSDYHMRRSRVIATVVLGSRRVVVTTVAVDSQRDEDEALVRVVRDFGRSVVWVLSGKTGANTARLRNPKCFRSPLRVRYFPQRREPPQGSSLTKPP